MPYVAAWIHTSAPIQTTYCSYRLDNSLFVGLLTKQTEKAVRYSPYATGYFTWRPSRFYDVSVPIVGKGTDEHF